MKPMKVAVLHDLIPEEADPDLADTMVQVREVIQALTELGHQAEALALGRELPDTARNLKRMGTDLVFNLVETFRGSESLTYLAPGLLESMGLPFCGAGAEAVRVTSNKLMAKNILREHALPTPSWISGPTRENPGRTGAMFLVKSISDHGSRGLDETSVRLYDFPELMEPPDGTDLELGRRFFAEEYISGREFNVSVLAGDNGPEVLPPAEIIFNDYSPDRLRIVGYRAKWLPDSFEFNHTPRSFDFSPEDDGLLRKMETLSRQCWGIFGLRGWARVDFRVDLENRPFILEVNANPCLARDAGFMAAAGRAGLDQKAAVARILKDL